MEPTTYEGYTNRATWNVCLWLDNDEPMYNAKMRFLRSSEELNAKTVHRFCSRIFGPSTPDRCSLSRVNWEEVTAEFQTEREEVARYAATKGTV